MSHKDPWTIFRRATLAALLLAVPLTLASCGGSDAASGSTSSPAASGSLASLAGAWVPTQGSLTFHVGADGSGYTWDPHAAKPAGGVIVVDKDGTYQVTLVSADGTRFAAVAALPRGDLLLVRLGRSRYDPQFFLSPRARDAARMIAAVKDKPQPKAWAIELAPGSLVEAGQ